MYICLCVNSAIYLQYWNINNKAYKENKFSYEQVTTVEILIVLMLLAKLYMEYEEQCNEVTSLFLSIFFVFLYVNFCFF